MKTRIFPIVSLLLLLAACGYPGPGGEAPPPGNIADEDEAAWTRELLAHRAAIDKEFSTSPTSPIAGTQYLKSAAANRLFLLREGRTFALAEAEEVTAELVLERQDTTWHWRQLAEDVACAIDGEPVASGSALTGPATFSIAGLTLSFLPGEDHVTLIVFDPERPEMLSFEHLDYFPPDRSFAVPARLEKLERSESIEMPTTRNLVKTFYRSARIHFEVAGERQVLTALKSSLEGEGSSSLFIPFKDATSGDETYGGGRYLEIEEPVREDFILDFNRAFNPLCNYSPAWNCVLPPRENHLRVAIRAGERTYPH